MPPLPTSDTPDSRDPPLVERIAPGMTAVDAWQKLLGWPHVVFFDSVTSTSPRGRYSFVAADPFLWIESCDQAADHLGNLNRELLRYPSCARSDLPPFQGGAAGLLGYELGAGLEPTTGTARHDLPTPTLGMGLYDVVVAFDHHQQQAWLISQGFPATDPPARRERARQRLAQFRQRLAAPLSSASCPRVATSSLPPDALVPQHSTSVPGVTSNFSPEQYLRTVNDAIEAIYAGELFQVNLAQRLLCPATLSSADLYLRLRTQNPAPFAGYLDLGAHQVCSASPECFLTVRDRWVTTRPIKGTRGLWHRPEADLFTGDLLRASEKDRAENVMIVDLMRNDLSRVCQPDSVEVSQLCSIETFAFVKHLVSEVRGELADDGSPIDLLRACFPGGSITGAPKVRAMQMISQLEPTARGPYCGSLAYIGFDGQLDANILIRTITASSGWWQFPVGGGIVAQSRPADEYQETWHKARGLLAAIGC
jgi:para-aminobenzoate synthetase component 1